MPYQAARPCRHVGCGALVRDGSGYCQAHQADRKAGRFADDRRGTASERGYGSAWKKLRDIVMRRDCGLCQTCKQAGRITVAVQVDHIVPKAEGGTDAEDNLQAICKACHTSKTAAEAAKGRAGGGRQISGTSCGSTGAGPKFFPAQVSSFFSGRAPWGSG
jgi:5-methylcytosine-specific restriction enzyme A